MSQEGIVWSMKGNSPRALKPTTTTGGYQIVCLSRRGRQKVHYVHTLVLEAYAGPRPRGKQARHLDGRPANNRSSNLRWGTAAQNGRDKAKHARRHPRVDQKSAQAIYVSNESNRDLAEKHGCSIAQVRLIRSGRSYSKWTKGLKQGTPPGSSGAPRLPETLRQKARVLRSKGLSYRRVAELVGASEFWARKVCVG